jgi:hypothetical protein
MSIKLHSLAGKVAVAQVVLLVLGGVVFLGGNRSQPNPRTVPSQIRVQQPVSIQFDRPLASTQDADAMQLLDERGSAIPGTVRFLNRTVSFIPTAPLRHDTVYRIVLRGIVGNDGQRMRAAQEYSVSTTPERFMYRTVDGRLARYSLATGELQVISTEGLQLQSYAVSQTGEFAVAALRSATTAQVVSYDLTQDNPAGTILQESVTETYGNLDLCAADQQVVIAAFPRQPAEGQPELRITKLSLSDRRSTDLASLNIELRGRFLCPPASNQMVYLDREGQAVVTQLDQLDDREILGRYRMLYEASTQGLLVGAITTTGFPALRQVFQIPDTGIAAQLSVSEEDATDPTYDPTGTWLAVSNQQSEEGGFSSSGQISISKLERGVRYRMALGVADESFSAEKPVWSADGTRLFFERIATDVFIAGRPTDQDGRPQDGEIWVSDLQDVVSNQNLAEAVGQRVQVRKVGISGSMVQPLP